MDEGGNLMGAVRIYKDSQTRHPHFPWQVRVNGCTAKSWADEGHTFSHKDDWYCNSFESFEEVLESLQEGTLGTLGSYLKQ